MDRPNPAYVNQPPWEPHPAKFNLTVLPNSKGQCSREVLLRAANSAMAEVPGANCKQYFTDGSVDPDAKTTGAAFWTESCTGFWRTSDSCSSLQTELVAIRKALKHALKGAMGL